MRWKQSVGTLYAPNIRSEAITLPCMCSLVLYPRVRQVEVRLGLARDGCGRPRPHTAKPLAQPRLMLHNLLYLARLVDVDRSRAEHN